MRERGLAGRPTELVTDAVRTLWGCWGCSSSRPSPHSVLKKNYDHRCDPPIPLFVTAARSGGTRSRPPPGASLASRPAFLVRERRLECPEVWLAIDGWLKERGGDTDIVAVRERSCEIFGDEKRLDDVAEIQVLQDRRHHPGTAPLRGRPGAACRPAVPRQPACRGACRREQGHLPQRLHRQRRGAGLCRRHLRRGQRLSEARRRP